METQVEVLETSDISNEEMHRILVDFNVQELAEEEEHQAPVAPALEPIITPNSPTLLVEESSSRFSSAVWYDAVRTKSIVLAGVGGIGRFGNLINFYYLCA